LIAFRFSLACWSDWPPERKTIPGTAAGTCSRKQRIVHSATSSALACVAEPLPEMTMFGFSSIPRRSTRCSKSSRKTWCRVRDVAS
jgi:hypothetical protein